MGLEDSLFIELCWDTGAPWSMCPSIAFTSLGRIYPNMEEQLSWRAEAFLSPFLVLAL
jgi:hypothetical protein